MSLPSPGREGAPERVRVTRRQLLAFRLRRQRLDRRAPRGSLLDVLAGMGGAQAQLESAAGASLAARVTGLTAEALGAARWEERHVAKAACMRRTLHLVPAAELAMFVRGTAGRADKEIRWMRNQGVAERDLGRALEAALAALGQPLTRVELAERVGVALGRPLRWREGGGWGSARKIPCVPLGPIDTPASYLLDLSAAEGVVCYGPSRGNQPTFVRADAWVEGWQDMPRERAEEALLARYLRAFGPATVRDFVAWTGLRVADAQAIWERSGMDLRAVDLDGWVGWMLAEDRGALLEAELARPAVRLLPYFDGYLLGHAERSAVVPPERMPDVFRKQGWVAPVVLVDGRVKGTWSQERRGRRLRVRVAPFARLSRAVGRALEREAEALAGFAGCDGVELVATN